MRIYGPTSVDNYDDATYPLMIADHNNCSAFEDWHWATISEKVQGPIKMESILINNHGRSLPRAFISIKVEPGKRILLRLINASTDTAYIFSIDDYELQVIGADLVPIQPFKKNFLHIGIGQRYHGIPETKKQGEHKPSYWIRTEPAQHCKGILLYDDNVTRDPTTGKHDYDTLCRDEDHTNIEPVIGWTVPRPTPEQLHKVKLPFKVMRGANFTLLPEPEGDIPAGPNISVWKLINHAAWVDYKDPTISHTDRPESEWPENAALFEVNSEDEKDDSPVDSTRGDLDSPGKPGWPSPGKEYKTWVYMLIDGGHQTQIPPRRKGDSVIPAAHPIHLHGHDFALLAQSYEPFNHSLIRHPRRMQKWIDTFTLDNPARRDVVLLPRDGYIVIAFPVDNPGAWLLHCHIAWHASGGLALQILEDRETVREKIHGWPARHAYKQLIDGCKNWETWYKDWDNHCLPDERFQDDSGV
ncbi:Cupredoxin [Aspergillus ibericus CBS 121593]|uniref:Cupredoxin n=1 Tax=Aspergillus ibericus CBS 121593 TaxID=1448316 RepID=A0A395GVP8_9EURO|nr:Cupredoxin [Aspergillus ibericus CBS 121593]RAK98153.1 Cupredoxin [Aspergillus ibericus CBS 121593]